MRTLVALIVALVALVAHADRVAAPAAGAPPPASPVHRDPGDFRDEYRCARAIMGTGVAATLGFGKLMRPVTTNVILMPVSKGDLQHGFYLVTEKRGAKFYALDFEHGQPILGDDTRGYNLRLKDEESGKAFGLSVSIMPGLYNLIDVPEDKLDSGDFAETGYEPRGKKAMNSDAERDIVENMIKSLTALPGRLFPEIAESVNFRTEAEQDSLKSQVRDVLCTCRDLRGSPEMIDALERFKKNRDVAPFTTEECDPAAAPTATGVRSF